MPTHISTCLSTCWVIEGGWEGRTLFIAFYHCPWHVGDHKTRANCVLATINHWFLSHSFLANMLPDQKVFLLQGTSLGRRRRLTSPGVSSSSPAGYLRGLSICSASGVSFPKQWMRELEWPKLQLCLHNSCLIFSSNYRNDKLGVLFTLTSLFLTIILKAAFNSPGLKESHTEETKGSRVNP